MHEQPFLVTELAESARRDITWTLGEDDPARVETSVSDLHEREHLDDRAIVEPAPDELDQSDARHHWPHRGGRDRSIDPAWLRPGTLTPQHHLDTGARLGITRVRRSPERLRTGQMALSAGAPSSSDHLFPSGSVHVSLMPEEVSSTVKRAVELPPSGIIASYRSALSISTTPPALRIITSIMARISASLGSLIVASRLDPPIVPRRAPAGGTSTGTREHAADQRHRPTWPKPQHHSRADFPKDTIFDSSLPLFLRFPPDRIQKI
ncbi:hypothetical protein [Planobispora rosea]|uniref:hypothetical protein n=1 Tax=Planobispora rosea TaxID=35762 RepID=UPI00114D36CD|nr:hypothetical protein [Planobispora rosea]